MAVTDWRAPPNVHVSSLRAWNHLAMEQTSGASAEVDSPVRDSYRITSAELGLLLGFISMLVTFARSMTVCTPSYRGWMDGVALLAGALALVGGLLSLWGTLQGPRRLLGAIGIAMAAISILGLWVTLAPICRM